MKHKILFILLFAIFSCSHNDDNILEEQNEFPTVLTTTITDITETSAIISGNVTNDGGSNVILEVSVGVYL